MTTRFTLNVTSDNLGPDGSGMSQNATVASDNPEDLIAALSQLAGINRASNNYGAQEVNPDTGCGCGDEEVVEGDFAYQPEPKIYSTAGGVGDLVDTGHSAQVKNRDTKAGFGDNPLVDDEDKLGASLMREWTETKLQGVSAEFDTKAAVKAISEGKKEYRVGTKMFAVRTEDNIAKVFPIMENRTLMTMPLLALDITSIVKESDVEEKAVSKAQQRFMGMVHAAQKGEKPASKEVAAVAKDMGKKDAKDFAATKHKGLPDHVKENFSELSRVSEGTMAHGIFASNPQEAKESLSELETLLQQPLPAGEAGDKIGNLVFDDILFDAIGDAEDQDPSMDVREYPEFAARLQELKSWAEEELGGMSEGIADGQDKFVVWYMIDDGQWDEHGTFGNEAAADAYIQQLAAKGYDDDNFEVLKPGQHPDDDYAYTNSVTEDTEDSPVASAITRRIMLQRLDLLSKYGPVKVMAAIDEVADFVGDVEEIGSSDVSGWIKHVEQMLGNMGDMDESAVEENITEGTFNDQEVIALLKSFDEDMNERGGYGDPDYNKILNALHNYDVESAIDLVWNAYSDQDGGEIDMEDAIEDLESEFKFIVHSDPAQRVRKEAAAGPGWYVTHELRTGDADRVAGPFANQQQAQAWINDNVPYPEEDGYSTSQVFEGETMDKLKQWGQKALKAADKLVTGGDKEDLLTDLAKKAGVNNKPTTKNENIEMNEELSELMALAGMHEAAKPDFLDLDKDGDKKEPMKDASKDTEKMDEAKPDFLDLDKDGDKKEPMKDAAKDKVDEAEECDDCGHVKCTCENVDEDFAAMLALAGLSEKKVDDNEDKMDEANLGHAGAVTMKHVNKSDASPEVKAAIKKVAPDIKSYGDRAAALTAAGIKREDVAADEKTVAEDAELAYVKHLLAKWL